MKVSRAANTPLEAICPSEAVHTLNWMCGRCTCKCVPACTVTQQSAAASTVAVIAVVAPGLSDVLLQVKDCPSLH